MYNEYENNEFAVAAKELGSAEEIDKIVKASERMQGRPLEAAFFQPSTDPADSNIVFACAKVISGYNQETFEPQIAASNESRLLAFSRRTNSEIAIGYVRNSVYNSVANGDPQFTTTYFPIGDPPIMVTVNSNAEDPYGDFWKCKHGNMGANIIAASSDRPDTSADGLGDEIGGLTIEDAEYTEPEGTSDHHRHRQTRML